MQVDKKIQILKETLNFTGKKLTLALLSILEKQFLDENKFGIYNLTRNLAAFVEKPKYRF